MGLDHEKLIYRHQGRDYRLTDVPMWQRRAGSVGLKYHQGMTADFNRPTGLWTRGFIGLILTQFAGAFNDNMLKGVLLVLVAVGNDWDGVLGPVAPAGSV